MSNDKEVDFIENLYNEANKQLKTIYKEQKKNRDELLKEIAMIMLTYTILNDLMKISKADKSKEYNKLSSVINNGMKAEGNAQEKVIEEICATTVKETFDFYSYNADFKDVRQIIERNFKGKHFSTRVWDNEEEVAKYLHKQIDDFLDGKINVNKIEKQIKDIFNTNAYNSKRLVHTEVNRCEDEAFKRFCKETGVQKVKRNEVLDAKTCEECAALDGEIFTLENAPGVVHPLCRGFNTVLE